MCPAGAYRFGGRFRLPERAHKRQAAHAIRPVARQPVHAAVCCARTRHSTAGPAGSRPGPRCAPAAPPPAAAGSEPRRPARGSGREVWAVGVGYGTAAANCCGSLHAAAGAGTCPRAGSGTAGTAPIAGLPMLARATCSAAHRSHCRPPHAGEAPCSAAHRSQARRHAPRAARRYARPRCVPAHCTAASPPRSPPPG